jgi:hypothetical protein
MVDISIGTGNGKNQKHFTKIIQGLVSFISFKLAKAKAKSQNIEEMGF